MQITIASPQAMHRITKAFQTILLFPWQSNINDIFFTRV